MNVRRLQATGAALTAPGDLTDPALVNLRATLSPGYAAALERQIAHERRKPRSRDRNGRRLETEPFCGDCHAIRPATSASCPACGSTQPPNLSRMNPRAAHQIGQGALH
jgi:hypothetical protein